MSLYAFFVTVYVIAVVGLSLYGFNALVLSGLFFRHRRRQKQWTTARLNRRPKVTVQLPVYNERLVVERLIDAAVALEYPRDRLSIQVLDDSTDATAALAQARVARYQAQGVNITYLHRTDRQGYKAGALAAALPAAEGEFIAIFDADFMPRPDFLQYIMPEFADLRVGMVQARWGHLNHAHSPLTRIQAIALDGHFVVEQTARSQAGLFFTFNGSGGVWRRACIEEAGGWQPDTLAEDLDLSYRAQMQGWQFRYRPEIVAPAEVPVQLLAFKRQQFRWVKGSIQCLRKFGWAVLRSRQSVWRKIQALFHLGGYLAHPLMLLLLLSSIPVILNGGPGNVPLGALSLAGLGPPFLYAVSQLTAYPDGLKRYLYFPLLMLLGFGVSLNNTWAVIEALVGRNPTLFLRTPKSDMRGQRRSSHFAGDYALPLDWTTWGELALAGYALVAAALAFQYDSGLAPFLLLYACGFGFMAFTSLLQAWHVARRQNIWHPAEGSD